MDGVVKECIWSNQPLSNIPRGRQTWECLTDPKRTRRSPGLCIVCLVQNMPIRIRIDEDYKLLLEPLHTRLFGDKIPDDVIRQGHLQSCHFSVVDGRLGFWPAVWNIFSKAITFFNKLIVGLCNCDFGVRRTVQGWEKYYGVVIDRQSIGFSRSNIQIRFPRPLSVAARPRCPWGLAHERHLCRHRLRQY